MGPRRTPVCTCLVMALAAPALAGGTGSITTRRVASGLTLPTFVTHAPGDFARIFIVEKLGRIRVMQLSSGTMTTFLDINALVGGGTSFNDERGLLGLAFHPDYATNGFFYVYYTNNADDTTIVRYTVSGNPNVADAGSAQALMTIAQPQTNHNGGWIGFSPIDGYLYIGTGDGGNFCDLGSGHTTGTGNAQDITSNLLGKLLRIDVDGSNGPGGNYGIPADNPFVGVSGDDEIWAYGLRNPWRCAFDRETGNLFIADVGQSVLEEVDFQPAASSGGENYGWACMEGTSCNNVSTGCSILGCTCNAPALADPIFTYCHSGCGPFKCSISGGIVYRGCALPDLVGRYFAADLCSHEIFSFRYDGGTLSGSVTLPSGNLNPPGFVVDNIVAFGEDAAGEMYIVDHGGEIFQVISELPPIADCNTNDVEDACDIRTGASPDVNGNDLPDECESCTTAADCGDADLDGIRDDPCLFYSCAAGLCESVLRSAGQADVGGFAGACPIDQACDSNDQFHGLNCFANVDTTSMPPYPCEPNTPFAINVDASGSFGACVLDGICDSNDVFAALNCFGNSNTMGNPGYPCTCSGPGPNRGVAPPQPAPVAWTRISLRAPRVVQPGEVFDVDVHVDEAVETLLGYQLHLGARGEDLGALELVDVAVHGWRRDFVFAGRDHFSAFNAATRQMIAGLPGPGSAAAGAYLATFTYRVPEDASGTFNIDILFDDHSAVPKARTFLFAAPTAKIGIASTTAAEVTVGRPREKTRAR